MSTLVAYDSSSDEDQKHAPSVIPRVASGNPNSELGLDVKANIQPTLLTNGTLITENAGASSQASVETVFGPVASAGGFRHEGELPSLIGPGDMSERDIIRQLTQASVPMTSIPSSPPGFPDPAMNARFARFQELKDRGVHFNEDLAKKSTFRNPALLSTMMARIGIGDLAQYSTSLPRHLWDPTDFPQWSYKEGLLKSQQDIRDKNEVSKKMLSASGKRTIDFASDSNSGASSRRSTPGQQTKRRRP